MSVLGKRGLGDGELDTKRQRTANGPSPVLFIRGIDASGVTEPELRAFCAPFGQVLQCLIIQSKGQAFVQLESDAHVTHMLSYYKTQTPMIRSQPVKLDYSNHTSLAVNANHAHTHARQDQQPNTIVLVAIADQRIPVTIDHLVQALGQFGAILKIVLFNKNNTFQALVQFADLNVAARVRTELDGKDLFANGFCTMKINYSSLPQLEVKGNSDRARDFTQPQQVPSIPAGAMQPMSNMAMTQSMPTMMGMPAMQGMPAMSGMQSMPGMPGMPNMPNMPGMNPMVQQQQMMMMMAAAGMPMQSNMMPPMMDESPVVMVSNLNAAVVVPNDLQTLFGVYGDVVRVKIMFNKKDTALVQYTSASQARLACDLLNKTVMFGQPISVRPSKHREISMPRGSGSPDDLAAAALSADYSEQPVHRFRNMNAAVNNIKNLCAPGQVLHVSSLPEGIDEQQLRDLFGQYGQVVHCAFFQNDKRMAMVALAQPSEAVVALIRLHNFDVHGKKIRVSFSSKAVTQLK